MLKALSILTLSNVVGGAMSSGGANIIIVEASESEMTIDELREFVLSGSPMTLEHWNQIPDEALMRYYNNAGSTMIPDQIFNAAFADYPSVFAPDVQRVKNTLMNDYGVTEEQIMAVGEREILWRELFSHGDMNDIASKVIDEAARRGVGSPSESSSEENPSESEDTEESLSYTYEEALELANGEWGSIFYFYLIRYGVTDDILAQLPEDALIHAAATYKVENPVGSSQQSVIEFFRNMYPEVDELIANKEIPDLPGTFTYDEALAITIGEWGEIFLSHIKSMGVTDEMLAQLPENAVQEAAVQYKMEFPIGSNPLLSFEFFKNMYPEVFAQSEGTIEDTPKEVVVPNTEGQKKIDEHIGQIQETSDEELELESIKRNQILNISEIEYKVKSVFLHEVEETESEVVRYLLGVRYEYNGNDEEKVNRQDESWQANTRFTQSVDGNASVLAMDSYGLQDMIEAQTQANEEESGEEVQEVEKTTVYYELKDLTTPVIFSVSTDSGVEQFAIDLEELSQLPPQSALYINEESAESYLFDFETLYILNNSVDSLTELEGNDQVEWDAAIESKVATELLSDVNNNQELSVVAIKDVYYTLSDDNQVEVRVDSQDNEEGIVLLQLTTDNDYQSITINDINYDRVTAE